MDAPSQQAGTPASAAIEPAEQATEQADTNSATATEPTERWTCSADPKKSATDLHERCIITLI